MGFYFLFWGFLFLIDVYFKGVDILPDFIGYGLLYFGLVQLERRSGHFRQAKTASLVLIVLAFISFVFSFFHILALLFVADTAVFLLNLYAIFHICYGLGGLAGRKGLREFQNKAIKRWQLFLLLMVAMYAVMLLGFLLPAAGTVFTVIYMIGLLAANVSLMLLLLEAGHTLHR